MQKRGQITIYVIIVLIVTITFLVLSKTPRDIGMENQKNTVIPSDMEPVEIFVQECVTKTAEQAVIKFGLQGGYPVNPPTVFPPEYPIVFTADKGTKKMQAKPEEVLGEYVNKELPKCVSFDQFTGLQITAKDPVTTVEVLSGKVVFSVTYPITVSKEGVQKDFSKFAAQVPARLPYLIRLMDVISDDVIAYPKAVDATRLTSLDVNVSVYVLNEDLSELVFVLEDNRFVINNKPYRIVFGGRT